MKKSVIEILKPILIDEDGDIDIYKIGEVVTNWPELDVDFENGYAESVDLENWSIISLDDDKMIMSASGDWQTPVTFTLITTDGDTLTAINLEYDKFEDGMTERDILSVLTK